MYLDEAEQPIYETYREVWTRWAFLTSVLLVLVAAPAIWAAASWGAQAVANGLQQQRHWAHYQALTTKTEALRNGRDLLQLNQLMEPKNPKLQKFLEEKVRDQEKELAALEEEWEQFKAATERLESQGERSLRRAVGSGRTAVLLLLGSGLAGLSGIGRKKLLWLTSFLLAALGAVSFLGAVLFGL
ncbi:MAG: DUF4337 family protein [Desulfobaccales bacterium]